MALTLKLPFGDSPDWESKEENEGEILISTPQSLAIHHSLRQSRNAWLTNVFPKFSSKTKSKTHSVIQQPAPHNLKFVAKCDVEIGPHVFCDTSLYEAHYLHETSQYHSPTSYSQTSYGLSSYSLSDPNRYAGATASAPSMSSSSAASGPFLSSLESSINVTPALIAQVNHAASSDSILQNLLQVAAMGQASNDQLRTLGLIIQTLANQQQLPPQAPASNFLNTPTDTPPLSSFMSAAQYSPPQPSVKRSDLVIEFRENHNERFLIPREISACEQEFPPGMFSGRRDIVLYTFIPFSKDADAFSHDDASHSKSATVIRFKRVADGLSESISGWVNANAKKPDALSLFNEKVHNSSRRIYLQHRLPEGDLLTQLRNASNNGYTMKSIKPSASADAAKPKRVRPRKPPAQASRPPITPSDSNNTNIGAMNTADAQVALAAALSASARMRPVAKRRKSSGTPKSASSGSIFINTMAPPPAQVPPASSPAFAIPPYPGAITQGGPPSSIR